MSPLRVSIVHWNRPVECVATVAALTASGLPMRITVVDNASTESNLQCLREGLPPEVEVVRLNSNVGWGPAHNVVLKQWLGHESGEYCVVSAHDALPQGDCLSKLCDALAAHPKCGMVSGEYGSPELPKFSLLRGARLLTVARSRAEFQTVDFCHGTLVIFRRECLKQIGVFDESYFAYGDEIEIALRARRLGWDVGLRWGAVLLNPGSWSGGPVIAYLWTRNSLRLAHAFGGKPGVLGRLLVVLLATLKAAAVGAAANSQSSPRARLAGIQDYFRGYTGRPPANVVALVRRAAGPS